MSNITNIIEQQKKELKIDGSLHKDKKSPFTGSISLRGKTFTGIVVSKDTHRTAKVEWTTKHFVKKYERFQIKWTKVAAHNPTEIDANVGDKVIIAETKPLSKTKKFIIIKNLGHSKDYMIKKESIDVDKRQVGGSRIKKKETGAVERSVSVATSINVQKEDAAESPESEVTDASDELSEEEIQDDTDDIIETEDKDKEDSVKLE